MTVVRRWGSSAGVATLAIVAAVAAATAAPKIYFDAAACLRDGLHETALCQNAYRSARAEFDKHAPRFPSRAACERHFPRCMVGEIFARGGVDFMPAMRGFVFIDRTSAAPVAEGGPRGYRFGPGSADGADTLAPEKIAAARRDRASRPAPSVPRREADEPGAPAVAAEPQSYPVPKARLLDLRERERRYAGAAKD